MSNRMGEKIAMVIAYVVMLCLLFAIIIGCFALVELSDRIAIQNAHSFEDLVPYANEYPIPISNLTLGKTNVTVRIEHCYATTSHSGIC